MKQLISNLWLKYRLEIGAIAIVAVLYFSFFIAGITCPLKFVTGISCPGCGMSRAVMNAVKGDFSAAFSYHPMWITLPIIAFFLIFFRIKKMVTESNIVLGVFVTLMVLVYIYRLFFLAQDVVVFSPSDSVFVRVYSYVRGLFN